MAGSGFLLTTSSCWQVALSAEPAVSKPPAALTRLGAHRRFSLR